MKERYDFEPSNSNSDCSPVASHSVYGNNSIEQEEDFYSESFYEWFDKCSTPATPLEIILWFEMNVLNIYRGFVKDLQEESSMRLAELMLNSPTAVQECDTTMLNQGSEPLAQNNTPVKEDWKEAFEKGLKSFIDNSIAFAEANGKDPNPDIIYGMSVGFEKGAEWAETNLISKPLK